MNRPLARIEGGLAIPRVLPFDDLPPPFGTRRRNSARGHGKPGADAVKVPPATLHRFRYPTRPKRHDTRPFEAAMAEARAWLEADATPCKRRSNYLQGLLIALAGSIVLAWLWMSSLAPRTVPGARDEAHESVVEHVQLGALRADAVALAARRPVEPAAERSQQELTPRVVAATPPVTGRRITASPARSGIRSTQPGGVTRPELAAQKTAQRSSGDEVLSRPDSLPAQWADLSSRQSLALVAMHRSAAIDDSDWNAHLTQRRVTDIPDAFQAN
jgi:hypothetical protein